MDKRSTTHVLWGEARHMGWRPTAPGRQKPTATRAHGPYRLRCPALWL